MITNIQQLSSWNMSAKKGPSMSSLTRVTGISKTAVMLLMLSFRNIQKIYNSSGY